MQNTVCNNHPGGPEKTGFTRVWVNLWSGMPEKILPARQRDTIYNQIGTAQRSEGVSVFTHNAGSKQYLGLHSGVEARSLVCVVVMGVKATCYVCPLAVCRAHGGMGPPEGACPSHRELSTWSWVYTGLGHIRGVADVGRVDGGVGGYTEWCVILAFTQAAHGARIMLSSVPPNLGLHGGNMDGVSMCTRVATIDMSIYLP